MSNSLLGLILVVFGTLCGGMGLLMTLGTLLQFSRAGAAIAGLFWLAAALLVALGIRLRRAN